MLSLANISSATDQLSDTVLLGDQVYSLSGLPLAPVLSKNKELYKLLEKNVMKCSASWDGFSVTWEIVDSKLYLRSINMTPCSPNPEYVKLSDYFPPGKHIFASWFTGMVTIGAPSGPISISLPRSESDPVGYHLFEVFVKDGKIYNDYPQGMK